MATFVLVHGAWHGGWCWSRLTPFLESAKHRVLGPSLTGLGDQAHLLSPDIGLGTHIEDVVRLIEEQRLRDVILVGHSYGGMVITGVADRVPDQIGHLVYLDTFVPRHGENMLDVAPFVLGLLRWKARLRGGGWRLDPPTSNSFDVEKADLPWMRENLKPHPFKTLADPLQLSDPDIVSRFPRTHVACTAYTVLGTFARRLLAQRALPPTEPGWRLRALHTGHDAMITMPRELGDILLEVAESSPSRHAELQ